MITEYIKLFFQWLDTRRDIKLQRKIQFITAVQDSQQATALRALEALSNHTELMKTWFQGFQSVSQGQPFSSVMREEDELLAEQQRELAKKPSNLDGIRPLPPPWAMESQIADLMFREDQE